MRLPLDEVSNTQLLRSLNLYSIKGRQRAAFFVEREHGREVQKMIRGTTPTFTFRIKSEDVNLNNAQNVYVTLSQGTKEITKTGEDLDVDGRTVSVWLRQEESMRLNDGGVKLKVQINWTYLDIDGETVRRAATKIKTVPVTEQLLKRVIE